MKTLFKKGFTLIELLVVIAIIGILASVVLASLNSARDSGQDAANKSNINNMRAQAELFYDGAGNYTNVCDDDTISQAISNAGGSCDSDADAYAMAVDLNDPDTDSYCVDSTGYSGENTVAAATEVADYECDGDGV